MDARPEFRGGRHPFSSPSFLMPTPEIDRVTTKSRQWLDGGAPGAIIYGKQRTGKTRLVRSMRDKLPTLANRPLPIVCSNAKTWTNASEASFFEKLLRSSGNLFAHVGRAPEKQARFTQQLLSLACRAESSEIGLLIDNAERLAPTHYFYLCDVYNELDDQGVRLFTLLVGEPDLKSQSSALLEVGEVQAVGRFMVEEHCFRGITKLEDFQTCLDNFDWIEAPVRSGWSATRYFLARAVRGGYRLSSESRKGFRIWKELHRDAKLPGKFEVPMQYFMTAVLAFLTAASKRDGEGFESDDDDWSEAIKKSGYLRAARYVRGDEDFDVDES